jgi:peptidoglycan/xylan/chitin deacetylase (PgdA/CDA1 family)
MLKFKNINITAITLVIILIILNIYFLSISKYLFFLVIIIWLFFTAIGSFNITWNYHIDAINKNSTILEKKIAITFDDGPDAMYTPQVLALLRKYNATATFFCIGNHIEQHPEIIKKIINEGHLIGNHSYFHSNNFGFYSTQQITEELHKTNSLVKNITGKEMNYFRPPFGVTNPSIAKAVKKTKHITFGWSIRSLDTVIKNDKKITNRVIKKIAPGGIILLHDNHDRIVLVLEQLLLFLEQHNYQTVSLETLSNTKAYA